MGFSGMPAGRSLQQLCEPELWSSQAGRIIPALLGHGSQGSLLLLPMGGVRAGHGAPGGICTPWEPSCIPQMGPWIRDLGRMMCSSE